MVTKQKACKIKSYGVIGETHWLPKLRTWGFNPDGGIGCYGFDSRRQAKKALLEIFMARPLDKR